MSISVTRAPGGPFATTIEVSADHPRDSLTDELGELLAHVDAPAQVWLASVRPDDDALLAPLGLEAYRDLLQLRCPLPAAPSGIVSRAIAAPDEPGHDDDVDALIAANNRAFSWHPEQSGLDRARVAATMTEPWFDPAGVRLVERDGRLAGFCWTKIHPADPSRGEPALGEIYVIAVDPDFHGRGLGVPTTLAGLEWLAAAGLEVGMLYVEADNEPALATYRRIGFTRHATNRAYRNDPGGSAGREAT